MGDRLMMADAQGRIYDGDQLVYVIARHRIQTGYMKGGVVGTLDDQSRHGAPRWRAFKFPV